MRLRGFTATLAICFGGEIFAEPVSVEDALNLLDGVEIVASGGLVHRFDDLYFYLRDGRYFRLETAVTRATLERAESCEPDIYGQPTCSAEIQGIIRVKDDYFEVLAEDIRFPE